MRASDTVPRWRRYLLPVRFLAGKVREKGVVWCAVTSLGYVCSSVARRIRPACASVVSRIDHVRYIGTKQSDVLYAFYDLAVSPTSFDIVVFLVLAELERKETGCSALHVVIVPGPEEGFRKRSLRTYQEIGAAQYNVDSLGWRLRNILVPCCWLVPSCQQVTVCASREEAMVLEASWVKHVFPKRYTVRIPVENYLYSHVVDSISRGLVLPSIQATPQALHFVSQWIQANAGNRKVISITLRECSYERDRNSSPEDWGSFARSLDRDVYLPVIIRDTEAAFRSLPAELSGLTIFPEASWNLELRAALYELSYLNMSVNTGPAALLSFNRLTRYLCFKIIIATYSSTTEEHVRAIGIEPGTQLQISTPFQRYVWDDDRLDVIQEAFRDMCDRIEGCSASSRPGDES